MNIKTKSSLKLFFISFIFLFLCSSLGLLSQATGITGDTQINKCETKTYTISIQNDSGNPITELVVTNDISLLTGFSYVNGTSSIDVNGNPAFCTADPTESGTDLIWNIDTLCSTTFTLNDGDTLNISYDFSTDCTAVSGSQNVHLDYLISGTPAFDDTSFSIVVLPGAVTIKKNPEVIPQSLGNDVTWTLTVENTGLGIIENVEITDVLGAGLSYVSSTPAGSNSGQTTTWDVNQIPALASMNPGDTVTIDITATVIACQNLENKADVRWGCDTITDCYNTAVDGGTASAAVQRIVKTPLIQFTPPDINFTYCTDSVNISFPINNIGDGTAFDVWTIVDFGSISVSNVSSGATYNTTDKQFELTNPILPGGTYNLSFTLNYSTWCGGTFPSGSLLWQKLYKDECQQDFYPPVELSNINAPATSSSLEVQKTGGPPVVQIGDQIAYTITSSYSGPINCGSGTTGDVTVIDTIPNGFTVVDAGGGTWTPGGGGTGGTITWTYTPPASFNTNIIVQVPDTSQCETYCFQIFANTVDAEVTDCCGCTLNASSSQSTAIECEELVDSNKTAVPSVTEKCTNIQYTNTYDFSGSANVDLNTMVFEEHADQQQEYVPGSLAVTYDGSDITGCVAITDNTPGGRLRLDFSGCAADSVNNKNLTIVYQLTITENSSPDCSDSSFYSWSNLDIGATGSECLPDGIIYETTVVSVLAPTMSLDITGLGSITHKCETQTITITLNQTSNLANPSDVRLVLENTNYYILNPAATVCGGDVSPTNCTTPSVLANGLEWTFGDVFTSQGTSATLQLDVGKRCTGSADLIATVYYDDNCHDDATSDNTCSATATESAALLLSGDLLIEKTPEVYYAKNETVSWVVYVTNRGTGNAYNVWVDDELGAGLDYVSAVVDNMGGVIITPDEDHDGNTPYNGATISIAVMTPGERRQITYTADLIDCNNLTNDVSTSWGCNGVDCQTLVSDVSAVEIPTPLLINTNNIPTPIDACSQETATVVLKNSGQTTVYNIQVTETLPAGLIYVPGTCRWQKNNEGWNGPNAAFDPSPTTSPMLWTSTQIPSLASTEPGDTIYIEFDVVTDCPFTGGQVTVSTQYENPCHQVFTNDDSNFAVTLKEPVINVTKTRSNDNVSCGELVEWTITVENTSGYTLPVVWVEDTMDGAFTFDSSVGDPPFTSDNGTVNGQAVTWELLNLNHNDTATLTLRAYSDSAPCSSNLDNTVTAYWGCGAADGSSGTKPGVDSPDDSLCLTSTGETDTHTSDREPDLGFLSVAVNPSSLNSCADSTELTVTIENTGPTDATFVDLVITLPAGLTYIGGSTAVTCGGVLTDPATDPVESMAGTVLTFYDIADTPAGKANNICDVIEAAGGNDSVTLVFSVSSDCFVTSDMNFQLYYYDCCNDLQYDTSSTQTITALYPDLSITKTPVNSQVESATNQAWTIIVTNNGTSDAQVVRIEDTLGDWLDVDLAGSTAGLTSMGGQTYGWEITNLAGSGGSQTFTLAATLNPDSLPNQNDCTAALRQNNVRAIWGCGTTGDAVDSNPTTQGYTCTHGTWANAPVAILQMPDLIITEISPTISCTADGTFTGSINVTVQNQGDGNTLQDFTVEITDGEGWTGYGTYTGTLNAGSNTVVSIDTATWSPDCNSCVDYSFGATVDSTIVVYECDESNNTAGPLAYTPPVPDLIVSSDTLAITCASDGQATVSGTLTVSNQGCGTNMTSNIPVRFTLFDNTGCAGNQIAQWTDTLSSANIAPSGSQAFTITNETITSNLCTNSTACQVSIRAEIDYNTTICECDGTNNTYCADNKNIDIPDLRAIADTLTIACANDGQATISGSVTIENIGCGSNMGTNIPVRFTMYDNTGCAGNQVAQWTDTLTSANISSGGGTQVFTITNETITSNLCTNSTGCQVSIQVEVDHTNSICECDGTNNTYCADNKNIDIPDLLVSGDTLTTSCSADGEVTVSGNVTIENNGCGSNMTTNIPIRFTMYDNTGCAGNQVAQWTETLTSANIAAGGGTQTFSIPNEVITTNLSANSTSCQISIQVELDHTNSICECDSTNNSYCTNKTVSIPDLYINSVSPSATCINDGNLQGTVTVNVSNIGCADANGVVVRLTSDCGYTFTNQTVDLTAGSSTNVNFSYTPVCSSCTCTFTATVDPLNAICECTNTNNALSSAPYTMTIPDLTVQSDTLGISCTSDGQATISGTITIENSGCGNNLASNIPVRFTLFDNTGCSGNQLDQWTDTLSSVNIASGGGTQTFTISNRTVTSDLNVNSTGCQVSIRAELDYTDSICECDGTNNTWCADNKAIDIPDIQTSADTLSVNCSSDGQADISGTVTIENIGCGSNLTSDIPVRFTMYDNTGCSGNQIDQWTETLSSVNIPAGGGTQAFTISSRSVTSNLITNSTNCQVSIRVEVDYIHVICESNGTNNTYCADNIPIDIPDLLVSSDNIAITGSDDQQITVNGSVTIENIGCGSNMTSNIPVRFTLYDNIGCAGNQLDQWTITLTAASIAANGGTQTFTVPDQIISTNICSNSTSCQVSARVEIDYNNSICEADGTNNSLCTDKSVNIPDLTINSVATTVNCIGDGSLTGTTVNVSNTGCGDATNVVVRLTSNCGLTFVDEIIDLAAGETKDVFFSFTSGIATCTCDFTATIDPGNTIFECNGTDNTQSSTASMLIPDLEVQGENLAITCQDSDLIRVSGIVTLVNNGCGPNLTSDIPIRFTLYSNTGCSGTLVHQWTDTLSATNIASSGGTQTFTILDHDISTNYCTNSTNCNVSIFIEADHTDSICEWDGTDNTYCTDKTSDCLDLGATSITATTTCSGDGQISGKFNVTVTNTCGNPITNDFTILVNDNQGWSSELFYQADLNGTLPINPGESPTVTINWTRSFTNSPYICNFNNIEATVNSQNHICEGTNSNNLTTTTYQIPIANLNTQLMSATCSADGSLALSLTISNEGCGDVTENFDILITDSKGNSNSYPFTSLGGVLPIRPGVPQTLTVSEWAYDCSTNTIDFQVALDPNTKICEISDSNNTFNWQYSLEEPGLVIDSADWNCNPDGSVSFNITITNQGYKDAIDVELKLLDEGSSVIDQKTFNIAKGGTITIPFISPPGNNINRTFTIVVDQIASHCECNIEDKEKIVTVNCTPEEDSLLNLQKICPVGQQPGGLFKFEIIIQNKSDMDMFNVTVEDQLPDGFQYVTGSSVLDSIQIPDPEGDTLLKWTFNKLPGTTTQHLFFSAIADADIDPGRYCNDVSASGFMTPTGQSEIISNKAQCCTVVTRDAGAGCCLKIDEYPFSFFHRPEVPLSIVDPYFNTEAAMFTAYSALNLWKDSQLDKGTLPHFIKQRLTNYTLSTIQEFYFDSGMGLTRPDGSVFLSIGGAYPEKAKKGWHHKNINNKMTVSQIGFEMLALNEAYKMDNPVEIKEKLRYILKEKLEFISLNMENLPHQWELKLNKDNNYNQSEIQKHLKKEDSKATLYDKVILYLSMVELKDGFKETKDIAKNTLNLLKDINNNDFQWSFLKEELFFTLALVKSGNSDQAKAKIRAFETQLQNKENKLESLLDYSMASYVSYLTGSTSYQNLLEQMKEKYYLKDSGIFAEELSDLSYKLELHPLASLMLSFNIQTQKEDLTHKATTLYRIFDEMSLFLKKRNLDVGKPVSSLLKNYSFATDFLPMLTFTKGKKDIAPVFSQDAIILTPNSKPLGGILIPNNSTKVISNRYETKTSKITAISYGLQYLGSLLKASVKPEIREEGRSVYEIGKKYIDSILSWGTGIQHQGYTLLPTETIATKGPNKENFNMEALNSSVRFKTETLSNLMLAQQLYLKNPGQLSQEINQLIPVLSRIAHEFKVKGYVPDFFYFQKETADQNMMVIPSEEKASKITLAKLFQVFQKDPVIQSFLESELTKAQGTGTLLAEDLIFLAGATKAVPFFKDEINTLIDLKDSSLSLNAADIIGRSLRNENETNSKEFNKSIKNLKKKWDKDSLLPKSDQTENLEKGFIYLHNPQELLLYLLALDKQKVKGFEFERTLNLFTYLLENEWGIEKGDSILTLPSSKYLVFSEEPKEKPEPGDIINFRVRVENKCPWGYGSATDLTSLFIKADFTPPLFYTGTQLVDGLSVIQDFQWQYNNLPEGKVLEYVYQAYLPFDFKFDYILGSIYAKGSQGFQDFGPDTGIGDDCEDIDKIDQLSILPLKELRVIVFEDRNMNGIKDVGELGIPGIQHQDTQGRIYRTDAEGRFNVMVGDELIGLQVKLKSIPSRYLMIMSPTKVVNRNYKGIVYFSLVPCTTVKGILFNDTNQNNLHDEGEELLKGIILQAKDKETITENNGIFTFRNLPILWQEEITIKKEQPFYKGSTMTLKIKITKE